MSSDSKYDNLPLLQPLQPDAAPPATYPINSLPLSLRAPVQAIAEHVQVPEALAGQSVLGAAVHLAQTRVNAWHPSERPEGAPCSLFMLTLYPSGEGKSSTYQLAYKTIYEAEKAARSQFLRAFRELEQSAAGLRGKARQQFMDENPLPTDPQTLFTETTHEPLVGAYIRGLSAASWTTDEGGQIFGGATFKSDTIISTLGGISKAFDEGFFERTRSRANQESSGVAYGRRLSMSMMAQAAAVAAALRNPLLSDQGFLPRFLLAAPESFAGERFISMESLQRSPYDDPRLQRYWARCNELAKMRESVDPSTREVQPPVLPLNNEAKEEWVHFRNQIESERGPLGQYTELKPFAARGAELALRLATVMGFFEDLEIITGECMAQACALVSYSLSEWLRYKGRRPVSVDHQKAQDLMVWLRAPQRAENWRSFSRDDMGKSGPQYMRTAANRDRVFSILLRHNYLLTNDNKNFRINPLVIVADREPPVSTV